MITLEELLQQHFHCETPFREDGEVTDEGSKAYANLVNILYAVGNITGHEMEDIVGVLDFVMNEKLY